MSFKLELEKRVASQEKTIFQKAKLIEDRGKSPFPTMKRTITKIGEDLATEFRENDKPVGATEKKTAIKEVNLATKRKYRDLVRDRADELTPDYVEEDGKKVIEDGEVRELDEALFQNKILSKVFSGITIKGKNITVEVLNQTFSNKDIIVKKPFTRQKPNKSSDRIRARIDSLDEDDTELLSKLMPEVEKVLEGIDAYYSEVLESQFDEEGERIVVDIRDDVLSFIGNEPYISKSKRISIYSAWKEVAPKHADVYKSVESLIASLKSGGMEEYGAKLNTANELFKANGQYVVKLGKATVQQQGADDAVFSLFEGLGKASIEIEGDSGKSGSEVAEQLEEDVLDNIREDATEFSNLITTEIDPLGYSYLSKYTYGILTDSTELNKIKEAADTMKIIYLIESRAEIERLDKAIERMGQIQPVSGSSFYLPAQILDSADLARKFGAGIRPIKISGAIQSLLMTLEEITMQQKMSTGGTVVGPRGGQGGKGDGRGGDSYVSAYPSAKGIPRELGKEAQKKLDSVLEALDDYLYKPLLNPAMTLDLDFRIKNTTAFKSIKTLSSSDFAKVYTKLVKRSNTRRGRLLRDVDLKNIQTFLKSINTPNIEHEEVFNAARLLASSLKRIFRDKDIIKQYNEEMAQFLGRINLRGQNPQQGLRFAGVPYPEFDDVTRVSRERIEATSLTVMAALKEFLLDKGNTQQISSKGSGRARNIKQILNELRKSEIEEKILEIHDSLRILKGLPIYYGQGSLSSIDDMDSIITSSRERFNLDLTSMDIVKMVEEVDSFSNISSNVGVSEEVVYFVKANFR